MYIHKILLLLLLAASISAMLACSGNSALERETQELEKLVLEYEALSPRVNEVENAAFECAEFEVQEGDSFTEIDRDPWTRRQAISLALTGDSPRNSNLVFKNQSVADAITQCYEKYYRHEEFDWYRDYRRRHFEDHPLKSLTPTP